MVQLGYPPYLIDIITAIDGVEFGTAWERRLTIHSRSIELQVIGRDDRIVNKRASGRLRDIDDVGRLLHGDSDADS